MPNSLIDRLQAQLSPQAFSLVQSVIDHAARRHLRAFLVGGTVRDLLLNRPSLDIDITIEGDAVALAHEVATATNAKLKKTTEFGTATILSSDFQLDLAAARAETYARPGALPKVRASTIDNDLLRRDFTINAIAVELTGPAPGKTLDPTGGTNDLHAGLIRVLHDESFQDDATRIIRAVRYSTRFGFRIEERTLDLLARDLAYLDKISGTRLRRELSRVFAEDDPGVAILELRDLGVLRTIHPSLTPDDRTIDVLQSIGGADTTVAWSLLAANASAAEVPQLARRLALSRKQSEAVIAMPPLRTLDLRRHLRPSELAQLLVPFPDAALVAASLISDPEVAHHIRDYLDRTRTVRPILRGDDVVALGVEQGPDIADVLAHLRAARLDGEITTRDDEVRFVEAYLARELVGLD